MEAAKVIISCAIFLVWQLIAKDACSSTIETSGQHLPSMVAIPYDQGRSLLIAKTETTFDQWETCRKAGGCKGDPGDHDWGRGARPVINVSWTQAGQYASWVGNKFGLSCRLPTETEWEQAAKGGVDAPFWWGGDPKNGPANCRDCGAGPVYGSVPAGSLPPNPFGLHEMNGNVWEWTADCWSPDRKAPNAAHCSKRVIKGGSWYYYSPNARWDSRAGNSAADGSYNIGFRIVCEPDQAAPPAQGKVK